MLGAIRVMARSVGALNVEVEVESVLEFESLVLLLFVEELELDSEVAEVTGFTPRLPSSSSGDAELEHAPKEHRKAAVAVNFHIVKFFINSL